MSDEGGKTGPAPPKFVWEKDDVEWHPPNPESPFILSLEDRQKIWKQLHPGKPLPERLRDGSPYYRTEAQLREQGLISPAPEPTADKAVRRRPKIKIHVHQK